MKYMDIIKKYRRQIFLGILMFILLCVGSYFIYHNFSTSTISCTLIREYENYKSSIVVNFDQKNILSVEEVFETGDASILKTKKIETTLLERESTDLKNKMIIKYKREYSKSKKEIIAEYVNSGYSCTKEETKKKDISYSLSSYSTYQDASFSYQEVEMNAEVDGKDVKDMVLIDNNTFDPNVIGDYVVTYRLNISDVRDEYLYRVIHVEDTLPPKLALKGNKEVTIKKGEKYKEEGVDCNDNYDKEIKVVTEGEVDTSKLGEYTLTYTATDSSKNATSVERKVKVTSKGGIIPIKKEENGITYFDGIILVNKKYTVPEKYAPGLRDDTYDAFTALQKEAKKKGYSIDILSGYRSYSYQTTLYNNYVKKYGKEKADTFSAEPGKSEHQTGLALDVGKLDTSFGNTQEGKWLAANAHKYGFIIRYPKGKESITGYEYEPWHIRYLGKDLAERVYKSGLTLEEYFGID